jgi:UDP-3-O-[3-hydroxymyristoyl] glucosamine N-acyltransferase
MNLGIYCAGGFGKEVYDIALRANLENNRWEDIFFIDDNLDDNLDDNSDCYLGKVYLLNSVIDRYSTGNVEIIIASGEPYIRKNLQEKVCKLGFELTNVIDPSVIISKTAKIGKGVIIASNCIIASHAIIGDNVAINVKSIIGDKSGKVEKMLLKAKEYFTLKV